MSLSGKPLAALDDKHVSHDLPSGDSKQADKPLHVVFDIDGCIALADENPDKFTKQIVALFRQKNLCIDVRFPHVIFPGLKELIRRLDKLDTPRVMMHFFSKAVPERNHPFVEKLLTLALGNDRYQTIKDKVSIKSKNDSTLEANTGRKLKSEYARQTSERLKNLLSIVSNEELKSTVLVDDTEDDVFPGQEGHLLKVPTFHIGFPAYYCLYECLEKGTTPDTRTFVECNIIFYIAGLLSTAIELANQHHTLVPDELSKLQYAKDPVTQLKKLNSLYLNPDLKYLQKGLRWLQEENPHLQFVDKEYFSTIKLEKPSEPKRVNLFSLSTTPRLLAQFAANQALPEENALDTKHDHDLKHDDTLSLCAKIFLNDDNFRLAVLAKKWVDKTRFIKAVINDWYLRSVFVFSSGLGKTFNLLMLKDFFDCLSYSEEQKKLFQHTAIANEGDEYLSHQGQYPVLFITFKNIRATCLNDAKEAIYLLIASLYQQYKKYVFDQLQEDEKADYEKVIAGTMREFRMCHYALRDLAIFLTRVSPRDSIVVLIDDYDVPVRAGRNHGYGGAIANFMDNLLGFITNDGIFAKVVLMGAEHVGIFESPHVFGMYKIHSFLEGGSWYADDFGFTRKEVSTLLGIHLGDRLLDQLDTWCGGYEAFGQRLFNPRLVFHFLKQNPLPFKGALKWTSMGETSACSKSIDALKPSMKVKQEIKTLLLDKSYVIKPVSDSVIFTHDKLSDNDIWCFLFLSGYVSIHRDENMILEKLSVSYLTYPRDRCLVITNKMGYEVLQTLVDQWFLQDENVKEPVKAVSALTRYSSFNKMNEAKTVETERTTVTVTTNASVLIGANNTEEGANERENRNGCCCVLQ